MPTDYQDPFTASLTPCKTDMMLAINMLTSTARLQFGGSCSAAAQFPTSGKSCSWALLFSFSQLLPSPLSMPLDRQKHATGCVVPQISSFLQSTPTCSSTVTKKCCPGMQIPYSCTPACAWRWPTMLPRHRIATSKPDYCKALLYSTPKITFDTELNSSSKTKVPDFSSQSHNILWIYHHTFQ